MDFSMACQEGEYTSVTAKVETPKKLKIRPLGDRVLVRVKAVAEVMKNGILLPDTAVEKPLEGEVIAVGSGRIVNGELIPIDVKVGDTVVFGRYSGNECELLGEKLLLLQTEELQAVYEN